MHVDVYFAAQARHAAGASHQRIELPEPATIRMLLIHLASQGGGKLKSLLLDASGEPHPWLLVLAGDEHVPAGSSRAMHPDEAVTILSPISGG